MEKDKLNDFICFIFLFYLIYLISLETLDFGRLGHFNFLIHLM